MARRLPKFGKQRQPRELKGLLNRAGGETPVPRCRGAEHRVEGVKGIQRGDRDPNIPGMGRQ